MNLARRPASIDAARRKYLGTSDGAADGVLNAAIRRFQSDQARLARDASAPDATGLIEVDDETWDALVAAVPFEFRDLRVLPGSKTVYVADSIARRTTSEGKVWLLSFVPAFAGKVMDLIQRIHARHGIAVSVNPSGDRRTFQRQFELYTINHTTGAGPGESNHNYGQAVDLGFEGLRWFRSNGALVTNENPWLRQLDPRQGGAGEAAYFWSMLRREGTSIGLHRGPVSDRPHLQNWDDARVDMAVRLGVLLNRAGRMRWSGRREGNGRRYRCDLGFGGELFEVGSSIQIWSRHATITTNTLNRGRGDGEPRATQHDVTAMREALRADFEAAEARWLDWTP